MLIRILGGMIATPIVLTLILALVLAAEWRTREMTATTTTSQDDVNEFRNTADATLFVRRIDLNSGLSALPSESIMRHQVSKSSTFELANDEIDPTVEISVSGQGTGATSTDSEQASSANGSWLYPKGALTLEPGEALHQNFNRQTGTGGTARHNALVHFHY